MDFSPFNPFTIMAKTMETFAKGMEDSSSRASAFFAEIEKQDAARIERTSNAIDEIARLQKETLVYTAKMGADMRKMSLDAMKSVADKVVSLATPSTAAKAA
jgi:hypothetical protein